MFVIFSFPKKIYISFHWRSYKKSWRFDTPFEPFLYAILFYENYCKGRQTFGAKCAQS